MQLILVVLFQSPRDINQNEKVEQHLGRQKFVWFCYKDATSQPFGYLLIDLSPKSLDVLR